MYSNLCRFFAGKNNTPSTNYGVWYGKYSSLSLVRTSIWSRRARAGRRRGRVVVVVVSLLPPPQPFVLAFVSMMAMLMLLLLLLLASSFAVLLVPPPPAALALALALALARGGIVNLQRGGGEMIKAQHQPAAALQRPGQQQHQQRLRYYSKRHTNDSMILPLVLHTSTTPM